MMRFAREEEWQDCYGKGRILATLMSIEAEEEENSSRTRIKIDS